MFQTSKNQTVVKLTVVPCAPVVEVLIKRPDVKYQLGFSVQNGVVCVSLELETCREIDCSVQMDNFICLKTITVGPK